MGVLGDGEIAEFLLELGMAQEEAQGAAEVVKLFGGDSLHLVIARGIEPSELAVEDEELTGGLVVTPAHTAGLLEQEGAGFGAVESHPQISLGIAGTEGGEAVVVIVDLAEK
jgi:hypothetical protein